MRVKALVGLAIGALLAFPPLSSAQAQRPLVVGQINLSFYVGAAAIVIEVLGRLGHETTVVEGAHPDIYARFGRDEVDMLVASWLPHAHGRLHAPLADKLVEAATLYEGARLFWSVPVHVPHAAVRSVDDLKKPDVLARMDKEIVGVGPGSGLMQGSEERRKVLGRVVLSIPVVTELERQIVVERKSSRDVARTWMEENTAQVDTWFAP